MDSQNPSKLDEIGDVKSGRPTGRPKSRRRRALRPSPASPGPPFTTIGVHPCTLALNRARSFFLPIIHSKII